MNNIETNVILSESWSEKYQDIDNINTLLQEAIDDFVDENDTIINIEVKTGSSGLLRFWIYTITNKKQENQ